VNAHPARGSRHLASSLLWIIALGVAGCISSGPSELLVHNRTLVAVVFDGPGPNVIEACSSVTFAWDGGWRPVTGPPPSNPSAVPISVNVVPFEAPVHGVIIVDEHGTHLYSPGEVSSMPPCAGSPPPLPTPA
jgi:hypothetical protein